MSVGDADRSLPSASTVLGFSSGGDEGPLLPSIFPGTPEDILSYSSTTRRYRQDRIRDLVYSARIGEWSCYEWLGGSENGPLHRSGSRCRDSSSGHSRTGGPWSVRGRESWWEKVTLCLAVNAVLVGTCRRLAAMTPFSR